MHLTSLWDTCAPEGPSRSRRESLDLFSAPLRTTRSDRAADSSTTSACSPPRATSRRWTRRDAIAHRRAMRADDLRAASRQDAGDASGTPGTDQPQASDVARCLDGAPLTAKWVEECVVRTLCGGECASFRLRGYAAPERDAIRGLMSDACRLELAWQGDGDRGGMPSTVFYKKVELGNLEYARAKAATQPMKIARDVKSAAVEAAFLACEPVTAALADAGVRVPRCFDAVLRPCEKAPIESKFALLLEDFAPGQGWGQERLLTQSQTRASLRALARLHATFMPAAVAARAAEKGTTIEAEPLLAGATAAVWPSGAYWQPDMQSASQMTELAQTWRDVHRPRFDEAFAANLPKHVGFEDLGDRLQTVARAVGAESHPFGLDAPSGEETDGVAAKWRTVIHGDAKAANIFLREAPDAPDGWEVGLIDFQWMGFGLGAVDAAHVLAASVDPETLGFVEGAEGFCDAAAAPALLDHYHRELCAALVANGAAASMDEAEATWTREEIQTQYESAILDLCRVVFGYQWVRVKASPETLLKNKDSMGKNSYNKSLPNAMWLVHECDALLKRRASAVKDEKD